MKLEEILKNWEQDSPIRRDEIALEASEVPRLHHKYFKILVEERSRQKQLQADYKILYKDKFEFYMGILSQERLKERGWDPQPMRILKTDLPIYMEADVDLQTLQQKIDIQQEKINFLESVIKSLSTRGLLCKTIIDWEKFKVGM